MTVVDTPEAALLRDKIDDGTALVGVVGLGYVGLPLALAFAERGFHVLGFDIDAAKVDALSGGASYITHLDGGRVRAAVEAGRLVATGDFQRLAEPDVVLICVPTPLTPLREPDMRYVERTTEQVRDRLRRGQLVVLESTTYPGTTDELVRPALESGGLCCGRDFFLAFSPERENPGDPEHTTTKVPKVVGGVDPMSGDLAEALYAHVVPRVVRVSSAQVAEAAKLTENVFRSVNIALVNELKLIYERMGIDVWEVLAAAATKPFGYMRFDPGPGWGGHCIPVDPFYLAWKARQLGRSTRFVELAGEINRSMPDYVVERVAAALAAQGRTLAGSRILVLGLAYKPNVSDDRESPSYHLMERLRDRGAEVAYHDPHVPVIPPSRDHAEWAGARSVAWDRETIAAFDAVVIATRHDAVDYRELAGWARCIVDTRNAMAGIDVPSGSLFKA